LYSTTPGAFCAVIIGSTLFKYKAVYYGAMTALTLVMVILALIDFMEKLV
jgi:hypothetical protein